MYLGSVDGNDKEPWKSTQASTQRSPFGDQSGAWSVWHSSSNSVFSSIICCYHRCAGHIAYTPRVPSARRWAQATVTTSTTDSMSTPIPTPAPISRRWRWVNRRTRLRWPWLCRPPAGSVAVGMQVIK